MLEDLRSAFAGRLLTTAPEMAPFLTDWRKRWHGRARAVVQPDTAADVAGVLGWCQAQGVKVVPQGGNTGLSGGSVPDGSGGSIVISLARLNRVRSVDPVNSSMIVEAGCTLQAVQQAAEGAGRLFPLSLAAEGSCTIGGNLATNAGGVHVLRYGSARDLCLGLEVATADGALWDGLRGLRKNNTGLDLRDLFIGSEGTLGIITAAVLKLFSRPAARKVAFVAVDSPQAALLLLDAARARLGAGLSAFELMSGLCLELVVRHVPAARLPLAGQSAWYVLIELSVWDDAPDLALAALLEFAFDQGWAKDAVISASVAQATALWALREGVSDAQAAEGMTIKHDVAVPISHVAEFIGAADAAMARLFPAFRLGVFGHLGDGNLHYNVLPPVGRCGDADVAWFVAQEAAVNRCVHDLVLARGGSISAEHGLGVLRVSEALRGLPAVEVRMMRAVRAALDPAGIMNPGKGI